MSAGPMAQKQSVKTLTFSETEDIFLIAVCRKSSYKDHWSFPAWFYAKFLLFFFYGGCVRFIALQLHLPQDYEEVSSSLVQLAERINQELVAKEAAVKVNSL